MVDPNGNLVDKLLENTWKPGGIESKQKPRKYQKDTVKKKLLDGPFLGNNYPDESISPANRRSLILNSMKPSDSVVNAKFSEDIEKTCVFCHKNDSEKSLIDCQGLMNSMSKKVECNSKFHLDCAITYNHGAFLFQYAALPECQNKLLCPLHCCSACNVNHNRQSAYAEQLIECAKCLRAYHSETCLPAGSKAITVCTEIDEKKVNLPMIICPAHSEPKKRSVPSHLKACSSCFDTENLVQCSKCVRSFHLDCREMQKLDGKPLDRSLCDYCLSDDVVRYDVPVLCRWNKLFFLAVTRAWDQCPEKMRNSPKFGALGYTAVEWPIENKTSIVSVNDLAQLVEQYLPLAPRDSHANWKKALDDFDEFVRFPPLYKEAHKIGQTSKHFDRSAIKFFQFHETEVCQCTGPKRCTTEECIYVASGCECPPDCNKNGRICNNRNVSEKKFHSKMEVRKAGHKGFGVFATGKIKKGEYLGEYVGEIINKTEKEKRQRIINTSRDFQGNHYMMDMSDGMTVDAARFGNITRYMNHSCNPNARSMNVKVWCKNGGENSLYDYRAYIAATRDISPGEEITFDYGMSSEAMMHCMCGAADCTGKLTRKAKKKKEVEKCSPVGRKRSKRIKQIDNADREAEEPPELIAAPPRLKRESKRKSATTDSKPAKRGRFEPTAAQKNRLRALSVPPTLVPYYL